MPTLPSDILITLLSNALLVVPLAIAVVLICRFVKRPAVAWCLWALVLLKFVTPAWYPLPVPTSRTRCSGRTSRAAVICATSSGALIDWPHSIGSARSW